MFSFALTFASTCSTKSGRSVFITVTGDSFAGFASKGDWFDLCTSAPQRAIVSNCLPQPAIAFRRRFCDFKGPLKITARLI